MHWESHTAMTTHALTLLRRHPTQQKKDTNVVSQLIYCKVYSLFNNYRLSINAMPKMMMALMNGRESVVSNERSISSVTTYRFKFNVTESPATLETKCPQFEDLRTISVLLSTKEHCFPYKRCFPDTVCPLSIPQCIAPAGKCEPIH